ncbi:MAG: signal peptidase I [Clostridia bacterium]|jgi:signal peptidase I|nr:signal peptidase I [Clostridia bacterium]MCI1998860.1 signal peptidase I [Clostridia bacterium]MCI2013610.1 signal peptidase I [Clostridia bacterium]
MSEFKEQRKKRETMEWIISLVIVIVVAFAVRTFAFRTVMIKGTSMEPNFIHGDIVLVNEFLYKFSKPKRGDVIVCGYDDVNNESIIKRIVALPGETIDFRENDSGNYDVYIDGKKLQEDYIKEPTQFYGEILDPYTVPDGCYFVMGDNRQNSTDSRWSSIGAIKRENIVGKVCVKIWPFKSFSIY